MVCTKCKQEKEESEFQKNYYFRKKDNVRVLRLRSDCKTCAGIITKIRKDKNREKIRKVAKLWEIKNREKRNEQQREWIKNNPEKIKKYTKDRQTRPNFIEYTRKYVEAGKNREARKKNYYKDVIKSRLLNNIRARKRYPYKKEAILKKEKENREKMTVNHLAQCLGISTQFLRKMPEVIELKRNLLKSKRAQHEKVY